MDDELLTPEDVAEALKVDWKTLRNWRYERKGPPFLKLGHKVVRYPKSGLEAWLRDQEVHARTA